MDAAMDGFRANLRKKGYKLTFQRMAIYEALQTGPRHPTAEEVHDYISKKYPMIGLSTVYNTLETLCEMGELIKVMLDPNVTRYDISKEQHIHLVCLKCCEISDIIGLSCQPCRKEIERKTQFQVERHSATFFGFCSKCQENGREHPHSEKAVEAENTITEIENN